MNILKSKKGQIGNLIPIVTAIVAIGLLIGIAFVILGQFKLATSAGLGETGNGSAALILQYNGIQALGGMPSNVDTNYVNINASINNLSFARFGGNDYINTTLIVSDSDFSVTMWFNLDKLQACGTLVENGYSNNARGWEIREGCGSPKFIYFCSTNVTDNICGASPINDAKTNTWYYVAWTYNSTSGSVLAYINGGYYDNALIKPMSYSGQYMFMTLGMDSRSSSSGIYGKIDEFRYYNRTITPAEQLSIYQAGRITNTTLVANGLKIYYPFNEQNGTAIYNIAA